MTTPTEFQTDPDKRKALRNLLDNPVFTEAVAIFKDAFEPTIGGDPVHTVKKVSLYDNRAGANYLLSYLNGLTRAPQSRKPLRGRELAKSEDDLPQQPEP